MNNKCEKLIDGKCSYYEKRPVICRDYSVGNCEKNGGGNSFKMMFRSLEEFEDWISKGKVLPKDYTAFFLAFFINSFCFNIPNSEIIPLRFFNFVLSNGKFRTSMFF